MIEADGTVKAIMCFRRYWGDCWTGFLLISVKFSLGALKELKQHIDEGFKIRGATRLQTESVANSTLREWPHFLGFRHEDAERK